jgi:hypothetical protein
MESFNNHMQQQFGKHFPCEISVEYPKTQLNFPFQRDTHEGLFHYLHNNYSIHQIRSIVLVETSSNFGSLFSPKENVLIWDTSRCKSQIEQNASISFTFPNAEFAIQGYRICSAPQFQPISLQLEAKTKEGNWIEIDKRKNQLKKIHEAISKASFECKIKGSFESFRLVNLDKAADGDECLFLHSIELFGTFQQSIPKIVEKTQIKAQYDEDQSGVFFYLRRKLSLPEFQRKVHLSASSSGNPDVYPPENVLFYAGLNWSSSNIPNQFIVVQFSAIELDIESYRFEILYKWRPLKWNVLGKNSENEKWKLIDSRDNELIKEGANEDDLVEITFNCQTKGKFQQFKFEMTGKSADRSYEFNLDSIELFGTLFEFHELQ